MALFLWVVGLVLAGVGVTLAFLAVGRHRRASLLGTPPARAGKVRPGVRKVKGRVVAAGELLTSPVGGRPCVCYRLRVSEERREWRSSPGAPEPDPGRVMLANLLGGSLYRAFRRSDEGVSTRSLYSWEDVFDETRCIPVVVQDDTGGVEVDLTDAEVVTRNPARILGDLSRPFPVRLGDFLARKHRVFTVDDRGRVKTMRVIEETLEEGARVTVLGTADTDDAGTPFFQAAPGAPLLVSEPDLAERARSARAWATGFTAAAGGMLLLAVIVLALGVAAAVRSG